MKFEDIMPENFPKLVIGAKPQIQEYHRITTGINTKHIYKSLDISCSNFWKPVTNRKRQIIYKGTNIRIKKISHYKFYKPEDKGMTTCKCQKTRKINQPRILYTVKISFKNRRKIKTFLWEKKRKKKKIYHQYTSSRMSKKSSLVRGMW